MSVARTTTIETRKSRHMSLIERVAVAKRRGRSTNVDDADEDDGRRTSRYPLFPFDTIRRYLEDHPLIAYMQLETKDVYAAILDMHSAISASAMPQSTCERNRNDAKTTGHVSSSSSSSSSPSPSPSPSPSSSPSPSPSPSPSSSPSPTRVPPNCPECRQGYIVLDVHHGCEVCERCGVVTSSRLNVDAEYNAQPDDQSLCRRTSSVRTKGSFIPKWVHQKIEPCKRATSFDDDELEHWNHYTRLSTVDLASVALVLRNWSCGGRHSRSVRIAAGLLHHFLQASFPDEDLVRRNLKYGLELQEVRPTPPIPTFACSECSAKLFDAKSARFHCRIAWGKKRRN